MFTKGNSSRRKNKAGRATSAPEIDLIPGDLKIKLPDKFEENKSKLDPFLT